MLELQILMLLKQKLNIFTEKEYYENFGDFLHPFTGINMVDIYKELIESENCKVEFVFSNNPLTISISFPFSTS